MTSVGAYADHWDERDLLMTPAQCRVHGATLPLGGCIGPKNVHNATGHTFRALFAEWDWAGWIKPQIDAVHSVGGNSVRLIGDLEGVNDGTFTQSYYEGCWRQLIEYCATLGMTAYPAGGGLSQISGGGLTVPQVTASLVALAPVLAEYANVFGFDVVQESVRQQVAGSFALANAATVSPALRAAAPNLKLTYSNSLNSTLGWARAAFPFWKSLLSAHVDFWDIHLYVTAPPTVLLDAFWGLGDMKPVVFGEFGLTGTSGGAAQTDFYSMVKNIATYRQNGLFLGGAWQWVIFEDGEPSSSFAMFDTNGTPRTAMTSVFSQFPTVAPA